ncbi:MAG: hypothetical protein RLY78_3603 [Pseudomonadota bacterium]|jgi:diguanylate cyclase (GGDEF)-like protein
MSKVVDHLAELTAFRDRDQQDLLLVSGLRDVLQTSSVAIHRAVGEVHDRRWLLRARQCAGDPVPVSDPIWTVFESLPTWDSEPDRVQALSANGALCVPGTPVRTLLALTPQADEPAVLELRTDAPLAPDELRLLQGVLRIYRNFQALLDYSERDTLTGLLNRKTFEDSFYKLAAQRAEAQARQLAQANMLDALDERRQADRRGDRLFIGVFDIDHFKQVNDRHGHLIGDEVLLLVSRLMRASFRHHDRLYRFGGEEFVVLLSCPEAADALAAFERFRRTVEAYAFPQVGTITLSVGFSTVVPKDTPASAFERADQAVYWAKTHGRNQVHCHEDLVADGSIEDASRSGDVELF